MAVLDVKNLMTRLLNVGEPGGRLTTSVSEQDIQLCCTTAKTIFQSQSSLIDIEPPVVVVGDIHGQFSDLLRIFGQNGFPPDLNYTAPNNYKATHTL